MDKSTDNDMRDMRAGERARNDRKGDDSERTRPTGEGGARQSKHRRRRRRDPVAATSTMMPLPPSTPRRGEENPFEEETMEAMAREFRHDRRANGPRQADSDWAFVPMDEWLGHLDGGGSGMEDETLAALTVVITETLSVRDALILSLIAGGECDRDDLIAMVIHAHDPSGKRHIHRLLSEGFDDPMRVPDEERCRLGVELLGDVVERAPARFAVQPLAIVAYVLWWMGDERACGAALRCLDLDDECTLAAIVFAAANRGIRPAWCR